MKEKMGFVFNGYAFEGYMDPSSLWYLYTYTVKKRYVFLYE